MNAESEGRGPPVRQDDHAGERRGSELNELSNLMVRLYKDLFGRGPTKARSTYAGPDVIVCTLENSLTPAEQALVRMGEHQRLRDTRMFFQYATEANLRDAVESTTGRTVRAFISGMDTGQDVAAELFYLEPIASSDGSTPAAGAA